MVSFVCDVCQETVKKNKIDQHCNSCRNAWNFTCVDCNVTFAGYDYAAHTQCITEEQKYYGQFAKNKKHNKQHPAPPASTVAAVVTEEQTTKARKRQDLPEEEQRVPSLEQPEKGEVPVKKLRKIVFPGDEDASKTTAAPSGSWKGWKKSIKSALKQTENGELALKKLRKIVIAQYVESAEDGKTVDKQTLESLFDDKLQTARVTVNGKVVQLGRKSN
eukprot:GILJ01000508.1.p1 GENE.GILJ01000508.1~~GILJ01000508.1.p1  ORF type:complete len:218 (-),score=53.27 GILJ01000508.1:229-882(-)